MTVIAPMRGATPGLGPMLGALAPGLLSGVIREVILAETGPTDFAAAVAEETGAELVAVAGDPGAAADAAIGAARAGWVLLLAPDAALAPDWPDAVRRHVALRPGTAGWVPAEGGLSARLADLCWALGRPVGQRCLLLPKPSWAGAGTLSGPRPTERLGRRIGPRLARLATSAA